MWRNEKLLPRDETISDSGWVSGSGIFETLRTENGVAMFVQEHILRANLSASALGKVLPAESEIRRAIEIVANDSPYGVGRLRLMFGEDFIAIHDPYQAPTKNAQIELLQTELASGRVVYKTYPYDVNLDLLAKAASRGFDEVLIENASGELTEGAVSNFIFLSNDQWLTPPLSSGLLPGIIRGVAIDAGLASEKIMYAKDIDQITHGFVLSSLRLAQPISMLAGRALKVDDTSSLWQGKLREITQVNSLG
jgi:branched-chain amino acid aminotransferase